MQSMSAAYCYRRSVMHQLLGKVYVILTITENTIQYVSTVAIALVTSRSIGAYLMAWYVITFIDIYNSNDNFRSTPLQVRYHCY